MRPFRRIAFFSVLLPVALLANAQTELVSGEVRGISREMNSLTVQHGEIVGLDLPAMKSTFVVRDPLLLAEIELHSRIRFVAVRRDGKHVIVRIDKP